MFLLILQPLPETVALVEDIVVEYVTDLVRLFCSAGLLTVNGVMFMNGETELESCALCPFF